MKKVLSAKSENRKNSPVVDLEIGFQQLQNIRNFVLENDGYEILKEIASSINVYEIVLLCLTEEKANELRAISEEWQSQFRKQHFFFLCN
ncbi:hypothetical protein [Thalassospira sp. 11-3]|uniref:hypothetical protein n=1 Tax=Thalassospira sp. 11-3 TaxID=2135614 RepID=UPI0011B372E6|nr:hypothetical protein [Thalassospira sp. 11-3]